MATPIYMSTGQLLNFTSVLATEQGGNSRGGDNRLIQPLNGRTIRASFDSPNPLVVSGALQFQTDLNANQFSAQEDAFVSGLAQHLSVPEESISISSYDDVAPAAGRRRGLLQTSSDVQVGYTVNTPTAAAASQVSTLVTAGTVVPQGSSVAPLASTLRDAGVSVTNVSPASAPTTVSAECASGAVSVRSGVAVMAAVATALIALAF
jgi:hypothetical protein